MSNPVLSERTFENVVPAQTAGTMTLVGTARKALILLALIVAGAAFTWTKILEPGGAGLAMGLTWGGLLGGLIVSLVISFKPNTAPYLAPVYAVLEGLFLGAISAILNQQYRGIVPQAVAITFATAGIMFLLYQSGIIKVTQKFMMGVVAATGAIALVYLVNLLMRAFGMTAFSNFLWSSSPLSIGISVVVTIVAALNLILDFDLIDKGVRARAPKFMEWYGAFGLMVTLVWLYLEILRLLAKLQSRD
jgi:Predicted membrane protein